MEYAVTEYRSFGEFKTDLDNEIKREAEGFVKIGYLLKMARDTNILLGSMYSNVNDFAQKEYGLDKSQVSRFIAINERFGEGPVLQSKYEDFGVSKLSLMLQLPDSLNEELTPEYTKAEINALKEEIKEEESKTDIEVMLEAPNTAAELTIFEEAVKLTIEAEPNILEEIYNAGFGLQDIYAPTGEGIKTVRIAGIGRVMLIFKPGDIQLLNVRSGEKEPHSYEELENAINKMTFGAMSPEEAWKNIFGTDYPIVDEAQGKSEKTEVAPVQQPKKTKVTKAVEPKSDENGSKEPEKAENEPVKTTDENNEEEKDWLDEAIPTIPAEEVEVIEKKRAPFDEMAFSHKAWEAWEYFENEMHRYGFEHLRVADKITENDLELMKERSLTFVDMLKEMIALKRGENR